jgi:hypothetical protein
MSPSPLPPPRPPDELEALTALVLRYLDGACSAEEVRQLKATLADSAVDRALFVQVCRLHGELHEAHAPQRARRKRKGAAVINLRGGEPAGEVDTSPPAPEGPEKGPSTDAELPDASAETDIRKLSGEDTQLRNREGPEQ